MKITEESLNMQEHEQNPPEAPVREESRSEREKLRSMPKKDRLWYIWTYYKFHFLAILIAIGVLWGIGGAMYQKSFDTVLYCVYLNSRSETELNTAPLEQGFSEYLELGPKELITTESTFVSYGEDATEFSYASMAKITALVAAKELDIIIGDRETMEHYSSMGGICDLETELPEDALNLAREHLMYAAGSDGTEYACGISLEGTWFAEESRLAQEPPILMVVSNSTHKDTVVSLLRYIFDR